LLVILSLLGAIQGLLFGFALMRIRRGNKIANRLLSALSFTISIFLFGAVMRTTSYDSIFPHLSRLHDPFPFLVSPLIFLYIKTLITKEKSFQGKKSLHFVPFITAVVYLIPYYIQNTETKLQIVVNEHLHPGLGDWYYVRSAAIIVQALIYLSLSVLMVRSYFVHIKKGHIHPDRAAITQIRFLIAAVLTIWVVGVFRYAFEHTSQTNLLVPFLAAGLVYGLGYICLRYPEVLSETREAPLQPPKYEKSTLSVERSEQYLKKLLQMVEAEKPYANNEITLQKIAEKISIPPHHLSQIINERLNQSFSDFINGYRVEAVKKMFLDPAKKHYSLLAIAEEAGFKSKSSFNSVFKKLTNTTPSEFRKNLNGNGSCSGND
jgi:AraC-like DNA-binding protein